VTCRGLNYIYDEVVDHSHPLHSELEGSWGNCRTISWYKNLIHQGLFYGRGKIGIFSLKDGSGAVHTTIAMVQNGLFCDEIWYLVCNVFKPNSQGDLVMYDKFGLMYTDSSLLDHDSLVLIPMNEHMVSTICCVGVQDAGQRITLVEEV
jgi:hypothetical protein